MLWSRSSVFFYVKHIRSCDQVWMPLLSSKLVRESILDRTKALVGKCCKRGRVPSLHILQVGNDSRSATYVRNKISSAKKVGIDAYFHSIEPGDEVEQALIDQIHIFNLDPACTGILVQLPLPPSVNLVCIANALDPLKDCDGFHTSNIVSALQRTVTFGLRWSCKPHLQ